MPSWTRTARTARTLLSSTCNTSFFEPRSGALVAARASGYRARRPSARSSTERADGAATSTLLGRDPIASTRRPEILSSEIVGPIAFFQRAGPRFERDPDRGSRRHDLTGSVAAAVHQLAHALRFETVAWRVRGTPPRIDVEWHARSIWARTAYLESGMSVVCDMDDMDLPICSVDAERGSTDRSRHDQSCP